MKLWGRKRRLDQSHDTIHAQDNQPLQRETPGKADPAVSLSSQAWRSLAPTGLSVGRISPTLNTDWGRTLSAWQDPTTTLAPLSHYKTLSGPNGEATGIAVIKSPLTPPATDFQDQGEALGSSDLLLPHRHSGRGFPGENRSETPLQRIAFSSPKKSAQTFANPDPLTPKQVVGYRPVVAEAVSGSVTEAPTPTGPIARPDLSKQGPTFRPDLPGQSPYVQRSLSAASPGKLSASSLLSGGVSVSKLVKAPQDTQVFRTLKPVQLLRAAEVGSFSQRPGTSSPASAGLPPAPEARQGGVPQAPSPVSRDDRGSHSGNISETAPLISSPDSSAVLTDATQEADKPEVPDLPLVLQRERPEKHNHPSPLKLGPPMGKTPDSAVSFANLGTTQPPPSQMPFIMPERRQEDAAKPAETVRRDPPPIPHGVPSLGPVPLQRLDLQKKSVAVKPLGNQAMKSPGTDTAVLESDFSETAGAQRSIWAERGDSPLPDRESVSLIGFKQILTESNYAENNYPNFGNAPEKGQRHGSDISVPSDSGPVWQRTLLNTQPSPRQFLSERPPEKNDTGTTSFGPEGTNLSPQSAPAALRFDNGLSGILTKPQIQRSGLPQPAPAGDSSGKQMTVASPRKPVPPKWHTEVSSVNLSVQRLSERNPGNTPPAVKIHDQFAASQSFAGTETPGISYGPGHGTSLLLQPRTGQHPVSASGTESSSALYGQNFIPGHTAVRQTALRYPVQRTAKTASSPKSVAVKSHGEETPPVSLQRAPFPKLAKKFSSVSNFFESQLSGGPIGDTDGGDQENGQKNSSQGEAGEQTSDLVSGLSQDDLRKLAAKVYPHISQKIKAEIEKDRERSGMITGLHR